MKFQYRSSRSGGEKELEPNVVEQLRVYLERMGVDRKTTKGRLNELLVKFRTFPEEECLLINQLEPIFLYVALNGSLWNRD